MNKTFGDVYAKYSIADRHWRTNLHEISVIISSLKNNNYWKNSIEIALSGWEKWKVWTERTD